jgi:hypothetical protein
MSAPSFVVSSLTAFSLLRFVAYEIKKAPDVHAEKSASRSAPLLMPRPPLAASYAGVICNARAIRSKRRLKLNKQRPDQPAAGGEQTDRAADALPQCNMRRACIS